MGFGAPVLGHTYYTHRTAADANLFVSSRTTAISKGGFLIRKRSQLAEQQCFVSSIFHLKVHFKQAK